jgi:CubicO group peptidase (beta-lactamase class C family)
MYGGLAAAGLLVLAGLAGGDHATADGRSYHWRVIPDIGPVAIPDLPAPPKTLTLEERIDQCVTDEMARLDAPGSSVAVLIDGRLAYTEGYGLRRQGGSLDVDADTIFRIGSVTKQMAAAAVMQQVELGTVDLDDAVTEHIPEFVIDEPWSADDIAVWHLLTHTSGFPDRLVDLGLSGEDALSTWATMQSFIPLHAPPGTFYNYSNPNFMLAGLVVERASGENYRSYFKSHLWEPAGMTSTTFDVDTIEATGNYAWGHQPLPSGGFQILEPGDVESWAGGPAGFAFSTAADLVRWAKILMDGGAPILSAESAAAMQAPQMWCHYGPDMYYGFGLISDTYKGLDIVEHGGSILGWGAEVLWVPDHDFAVAVLNNTRVPPSRAAYCIVDAVLEPEEVPPPDGTTSPDAWRPFRGGYDGIDVYIQNVGSRVWIEDEELMIQIGPGSNYIDAVKAEALQIYPHTFVIDTDGDGIRETDFTFIKGDAPPGTVDWLRHRYLVGKRPAERRSSGARRSR